MGGGSQRVCEKKKKKRRRGEWIACEREGGTQEETRKEERPIYIYIYIYIYIHLLEVVFILLIGVSLRLLALRLLGLLGGLHGALAAPGWQKKEGVHATSRATSCLLSPIAHAQAQPKDGCLSSVCYDAALHSSCLGAERWQEPA